LLCLSILIKIPIAPKNINNAVDPALINGSGSPVGGIEPVNTSYCAIKFSNKKEQVYCSFLFY